MASDRGGAIFNDGTLNISNCQFVNNEALGGLDGSQVQGGAIFNNINCLLNAQNSTFSGNLAEGGTSSILFGGTADAYGGVIPEVRFPYPTLLSTARSRATKPWAATGLSCSATVRAGAMAERRHIRRGRKLRFERDQCHLRRQRRAGPRPWRTACGRRGIYLQNGGLGTIRLVNDTIVNNEPWAARAMAAPGAAQRPAAAVAWPAVCTMCRHPRSQGDQYNRGPEFRQPGQRRERRFQQPGQQPHRG